MHNYNVFVEKNIHRHLALCDGMNTASLYLFYASAEFTKIESEYVAGVGTNPAKLGERYKGILCDSLPPLEHYMVDTLHFK